HRDDIERHYLKMLTQAKREVIIANAYFSPAIACSTQCVKPPAVA
ncbi:cardiolipin synthase 2, partial [Salmonella enterica subsp. enterica serovar Newport str. WA_14881]